MEPADFVEVCRYGAGCLWMHHRFSAYHLVADSPEAGGLTSFENFLDSWRTVQELVSLAGRVLTRAECEMTLDLNSWAGQ